MVPTNIADSNEVNEINVSIGRVHARISSDCSAPINGISARYRDFFCDGTPEMMIHIELSSMMPTQKMGGGLQFLEQSDRINIHHPNFHGELRRDDHHRIRLRQLNVAHLQFFIRCCYGYLAPQRTSLVVHASAVVDNDGGSFVFVGRSGLGKTTIAKSCSQSKVVLSDDGVFIKKLGGSFEAFGTPFGVGKSTEFTLSTDITGRNAHAPIRAILLLRRGECIRFRPLSPQEALTCILYQSQMCRFLGLSGSRHLVRASFDLCAELVDHVPCYEMHFTPEEPFWEEIRTL